MGPDLKVATMLLPQAAVCLLMGGIAGVSYETRYFYQPLDHFGFFAGGSLEPRLRQRYLISTKHWDMHKGPILFYAGNEADITDFANNTGWMWEQAPLMKALVVFSEQRYFGESVPDGLAGANYRYLSSQQVLADHVALIIALKTELGAWDCATIAVGGSYGGMLAAWLRYQFPHQFDGALAASAPLAGFTTTGVYDVMSKDFECAAGLQQAFRIIWSTRSNATARAETARVFNFCNALDSEARVEVAMGFLQQQLFVLAQSDYPTPSDFIGHKLPAKPAAVSCARFTVTLAKSGNHLEALSAAVDVAISGTNTDSEAARTCTLLEQKSFMDTLPGFIPGAWTFQRCSQVIIPYAAGAASRAILPCDEFAPNCWDPKVFANWCNASHGVTPRDEAQYFGGSNLTGASNIILSNGDRDPWGAGGIYHNLSASVVAIKIEGGAHHYDLRFSSPLDTPSVVRARAQEAAIVRGWIEDKAVQLAQVGNAIGGAGTPPLSGKEDSLRPDDFVI